MLKVFSQGRAVAYKIKLIIGNTACLKNKNLRSGMIQLLKNHSPKKLQGQQKKTLEMIKIFTLTLMRIRGALKSKLRRNSSNQDSQPDLGTP